MTTSDKELRTKDVARILGVSTDTVVRWINAGKLKGYKKGWLVGKTTPYVVLESELRKFMQRSSVEAAK